VRGDGYSGEIKHGCVTWTLSVQVNRFAPFESGGFQSFLAR